MNTFIPDDLYKEIIANVPIACIDIAIKFEGKILLVKRRDAPAKGEWWVPGGRVLKGEMIKEAAYRKAKEEVGIDCHVGSIIHTAETIFSDGPFGESIHSINSCFLLIPKDTHFSIKLDNHHGCFKWIDRIPLEINFYVEKCLILAGLEK